MKQLFLVFTAVLVISLIGYSLKVRSDSVPAAVAAGCDPGAPEDRSLAELFAKTIAAGDQVRTVRVSSSFTVTSLQGTESWHSVRSIDFDANRSYGQDGWEGYAPVEYYRDLGSRESYIRRQGEEWQREPDDHSPSKPEWRCVPGSTVIRRSNDTILVTGAYERIERHIGGWMDTKYVESVVDGETYHVLSTRARWHFKEWRGVDAFYTAEQVCSFDEFNAVVVFPDDLPAANNPY